MSVQYDNLSADLIWQVARKQNAYLCKRKQSGGVQFSRDPMNLVNKHSRKHEGFVNEKAIGITADSNTVLLTTKLPSRANKPAASTQTSSFSASTPSRKLFKGVVSSTAKKGYRADLRADAVARASAVKRSQRDTHRGATEKKLRGSAARKAAEQKKSEA